MAGKYGYARIILLVAASLVWGVFCMGQSSTARAALRVGGVEYNIALRQQGKAVQQRFLGISKDCDGKECSVIQICYIVDGPPVCGVRCKHQTYASMGPPVCTHIHASVHCLTLERLSTSLSNPRPLYSSSRVHRDGTSEISPVHSVVSSPFVPWTP